MPLVLLIGADANAYFNGLEELKLLVVGSSKLSLPDSLSGVFRSEEEVVEPRGQQEGSDLADGPFVVDVDLAACLLDQLGSRSHSESQSREGLILSQYQLSPIRY